jgi:hypothetical protein
MMVERVYYEVTGDTDDIEIASLPFNTLEEAIAIYNKMANDDDIFNLVIRKITVIHNEEIIYP